MRSRLWNNNEIVAPLENISNFDGSVRLTFMRGRRKRKTDRDLIGNLQPR